MTEDLKYDFIEEINECNICYKQYNESFKCNRCLWCLNVSIIFILLIKITVLSTDLKTIQNKLSIMADKLLMQMKLHQIM
jgi:hypothetical protein